MQTAFTLDDGKRSAVARAAVDRPPALDRWAVAATVAGNALEFYDFLAYSAFAVYIGKAFFPVQTEFASLLLSLATFGVGFFTRPLGGVLIGAFADRAGRRPALMLTIALMAVGTLAVAVTPSYAAIGIAAPLILVAARLLQGLALGGEVGASTAVLLECAPRAKRGVYTSLQNASQGVALFASGLVGVVVAAILSRQQLADWGWRVPFALGLVIVPIGLYLRRRLPETLQQAHTGVASAGVLRQLSERHLGSLTLSMLIIMCLTISTYVNNYMTTYALTTLGLPPFQAMWATLVGGAVIAVGAVWGGQLSDRFGRKPLMILPRVALTLLVYPAFAFLVSEKSLWSLVAVAALLNLLSTMSAAAATAAIVETFPNAVRSTGMAISYALSVSVFGGTTQFVIAWLIGATHDPLSPAYYVIVSSLISLWAMFRLPETNKT